MPGFACAVSAGSIRSNQAESRDISRDLETCASPASGERLVLRARRDVVEKNGLGCTFSKIRKRSAGI